MSVPEEGVAVPNACEPIVYTPSTCSSVTPKLLHTQSRQSQVAASILVIILCQGFLETASVLGIGNVPLFNGCSTEGKVKRGEDWRMKFSPIVGQAASQQGSQERD